METKLEQIAAKAVKQRPKSVVREIRTPRSVGTGGGRPPPVTRWAPSNGCPYRNRVLEPSQFIRLLDTAFAFCRRDRRPPGNGCQNRGLYDIKVYGVKEDAALPEDSGTVFVR
jgi:hypothetical protein